MLPDPRILEPFVFGVFAGVFGVLFAQAFSRYFETRRHLKRMKTDTIYRFRQAELIAAQYNADKAKGD